MPDDQTHPATPHEAHKEHHAAAPKKMRANRKHILILLSVVFLIIAIIWLVYYLLVGQFQEYTDDAYVDGNLVRIMPQVPGTVTGINTDDTQLVEQGQTIVKLDEADMAIALARAEANLANTVRKVRQLYDDASQAQSNLVLRRADLENAQTDLQRRQGLVGERAISREELQHYLTTETTAQASYDLAQAKLSAAVAQVENTTLYNHPLVQQAKVNVQNAYLNFYRTTIIAPVTGYVAKRTVQVGQQVTPGTSMMAVAPLNEIWINANYKESQLERLRIGQEVTLKVDAYDGVVFHGKIQGLSAGTGSAFDLLPPQNATGNWIKIVQRVPVRVLLDPEEIKKHPLRIGLSVRVTTHTFGLKGDVLTTTPNTKTIYQTNVFENELTPANKIIEDIIHANAPDTSLAAQTSSVAAPAVIKPVGA
jgi:membrane fusion protein (multidrug efflux system)